MDIVKRTRNESKAEKSLIHKVVAWAARLGIFDAVKIVRVHHAPGKVDGCLVPARAIMTRVLEDGRVELWCNLADTALGGKLSVTRAKRHIFSKEMVGLARRFRQGSANTTVYSSLARNRSTDLIQRSSRMVKLTMDFLRSPPCLIAKCIDKVQRGGTTIYSDILADIAQFAITAATHQAQHHKPGRAVNIQDIPEMAEAWQEAGAWVI